MSNIRLTQYDIDRKYFSLSRGQRDDVKLFVHSGLWTTRLLALHRNIHQSTANRRLRKLIDAQVLTVTPGHPWSIGGRTPNMYRLTTIGEQLLTRLLGDAPHVVVPDVTDEAAITRYRVALEVAIRSGVLTTARIFPQFGFTLLDGKRLMVQPDLTFYDEAGRRDVYVEVAPSDNPSPDESQFEAYAQVFADYIARGHATPLLIVVYPTRDVEAALQREQMAAAAQAVRAYPDVRNAFASVNLDTLRERRVRRLNQETEIDGRGQPVIMAGLMQSLSHWFDGEVHHG